MVLDWDVTVVEAATVVIDVLVVRVMLFGAITVMVAVLVGGLAVLVDVAKGISGITVLVSRASVQILEGLLGITVFVAEGIAILVLVAGGILIDFG